jgi:hypothetical protein
MRPTAKDEHVSNDYVPKHTTITNPGGSRRTKHQLYGDLPLEEYVDLMYNLICEADADIVSVRGGLARRALRKRLGLKKARYGIGQNYEIIHVVISGKMVNLGQPLQIFELGNTFLASPNFPLVW